MSEAGSIWLFNIQSHNWPQCRDGPPDLDVHGDHFGHPFHGLSDSISYLEDEMIEGELAIVRQSESGIEELWEIKETAPVTDQSYHRWIDADGQPATFETFVYCRRVHAFDSPIKSTNHGIKGTDFARFNKGANILSDEYAEKFIDILLEEGNPEEKARRRLEVAKATFGSTESATLGARETEEPEEDSQAVLSGDDLDLTKPSAEDTTGQTGSSGGTSEQISEQFRQEILALYKNTCLLSDITGSPFLTVAHVVPRSEDPDLVEHPDNVVVLSRDLHAAFDDYLFTFDTDMRLRVDPYFEPEDEFLKRTITSREGEKISFPEPNGIEVTVDEEFIRRRNKKIPWLS